MSTFFMIIAIILLFLGLPTSIVLTIIAFIKKGKTIFKVSIPIVLGAFMFFSILSVISLPETEVAKQDPVKIEEKSNEKEETDKKTKEEPKQQGSEKPKQETPKKESEKTENNIEDKQEKPKTELTEKEYKKLCKEYNYKDVLRNPEKYVGKKIVITLEISTVKQESWSNPVKYYFAYSESEPGSGFYFGDEYAVFDKRENKEELKLLEDDIIKVWGEISEPQETSSLIVNSEELFCIDMKYVELLSE